MVTYYRDEHSDIATAQRIKSGNNKCGDAYVVLQKGTYSVCAVVDGLGSGEGAHLSAEAAIDVIKENHLKDVKTILEECNKVLARKRGAVMTLVKIDYNKEVMAYANFGNIGFALYNPDGTTVQPLPKRGYLCGRNTEIASSEYGYMQGSMFLLYSDGVEEVPSRQLLFTRFQGQDTANHSVFNVERYKENDDATLMVGRLK
ncbi:SpoIIE family protein phosphatase [Shouchella shacheensis]|uniref:SpoIIE family protein phosphatase n=1 Tax=Shouchella shacheensis TaxID=1649580 RepID=UPI000740302F|nr:SpoIIE family protein phosphatase [Shouchella shacheensis]